MSQSDQHMNSSYESFYAKRTGTRVYPTEFVVRTFLAQYPQLHFDKPNRGDKVLDMAFGDGRNTVFLCDQGYEVHGLEITEGIVNQTQNRLETLGCTADLRVGRNSSIPFTDNYFDYILACHCCYYCDDNETFADNMAEYARVMKPGSWLIASVAFRESYIFNDAIECDDGSLRIKTDPYGNREGYRLHAFSNKEALQHYLSRWFCDFSFGFADNDYYGIIEKVFWVVCRKV